MKLTIGHLYGDLMNIYGDRGNIISLTRRAQWAGVEVDVRNIALGQPLDPDAYDILFIGGGQDREQALIADDLQKVKGKSIIEAVEDGGALLAVCGGYQLLGKYFKTGVDLVLPGIGLFDAWTVAGNKRCIGDVIVECSFTGERHTLVGFENHSGKTYLGPNAQPLGKVVHGFGNNAEDGYEGAIYKNAYGTYLHGSILPKNPWFTDHLILSALHHRYGAVITLPYVDTRLEDRAHQAVIARIHGRGKMDTGAI